MMKSNDLKVMFMRLMYGMLNINNSKRTTLMGKDAFFDKLIPERVEIRELAKKEKISELDARRALFYENRVGPFTKKYIVKIAKEGGDFYKDTKKLSLLESADNAVRLFTIPYHLVMLPFYLINERKSQLAQTYAAIGHPLIARELSKDIEYYNPNVDPTTHIGDYFRILGEMKSDKYLLERLSQKGKIGYVSGIMNQTEALARGNYYIK